MHYRFETGHPGQSQVVWFYKFAAINGNRFIGFIGRNREAPDIALLGTIRVRIIDLIDSPMVSSARDEAVRVGVSKKAGNIKLHAQSLITPEYIRVSSAVISIVEIIAHVHIV